MLPTDLTRYILRKEYLLQAKASLGALDIQLTHIYELLMLNPEGAFTNKDSNEAIQKLNKMADDLGNLLDLEQHLLASTLKSGKQIFKKIIIYKYMQSKVE